MRLQPRLAGSSGAKEPDYYEIIGYLRSGGREYIYQGNDWSTVSDLMPNQGEPDARYARAELYKNGKLIESNVCGLPEQSTPAREKPAASEVVYVVLPPEQPRVEAERPMQPIINVTVQPPERQQYEGQSISPNGHPWDKEERKTEPLPIPAAVIPSPSAEKEYRYVPPEVRRERKPEGKSEVQQPVKPEGKKKVNEPDKEKFNEPLSFSQPEPPSQAGPRKKFQHEKRDRGRQRKYHQTIALLEAYYDKDTEKFDSLDEQMQRYYKREYAEYFGRETRAKADKRLANRTKAVRTRRESERRKIAEISRNLQRVPDHGTEVVDIQDERRKRAGT